MGKIVIYTESLELKTQHVSSSFGPTVCTLGLNSFIHLCFNIHD